MKGYMLDVSKVDVDGGRLEQIKRYLSLDRLQKLQRMKKEQAIKLSLGAGLLLAYAYAREEYEGELEIVAISDALKYLETSQRRLPEIRKKEKGKPCFIDSEKHGYFNLSHSGDMVFLVFDKEEVGCDIQKEQTKKLSEIGNRFFGPQEKQILTMLPEAEKSVYFFTMWCAKEALGKYTGQGLAPELEKDLTEQMQEKNVDIRVFSRKCNEDTYYFATCREKGERQE